MSNTFNKDALHGELALVTGASRGIGAAIAQALAAAGAPGDRYRNQRGWCAGDLTLRWALAAGVSS